MPLQVTTTYQAARDRIQSVLEHAKQVSSDSGYYYWALHSQDLAFLKQIGILGEEGMRIRKVEYHRTAHDRDRITVYPVNMERARHYLDRLNEMAEQRGTAFRFYLNEI